MAKRRKRRASVGKSINFRSLLIGLILLSAVVGVIIEGPSLFSSVYSGGWEITTSIVGIEVNNKLYTADKLTQHGTVGAKLWDHADIDDPMYGYPSVTIKLSDAKHVNYKGEVTDNDQPVETKEVKVGNHTYVYDLHLFKIDVAIRTVTDVVKGQVTVHDPTTDTDVQIDVWRYECYDPDNIIGGKGSFYDFRGKKLFATYYIKFSIQPWQIRTQPPDGSTNMTLNDVWAGIMAAYVMAGSLSQKAIGTDTAMQSVDLGWKSYDWPSGGTPINMYYSIDDKNPLPQRTISDIAPDDKIPSTVYMAFSGGLYSGADVKWAYDILGWKGPVTQVDPIDIEVKFSIIVEVLTIHDFVLQTGRPADIEHSNDTGYTPNDMGDNWRNFWGGIGAAFADPRTQFFMMLGIGIAAVVLIVLFVPGVKEAILLRGLRH